MGRSNFLVEGVSGTGKTSVAEELQRRGHHAVHGDRELAYQGDPATGVPTDTRDHDHHVWDVDRVRALVTDDAEEMTFFCGGSRNFAAFIDLFDGVFVLEVDLETLRGRLDLRSESEWGGRPEERVLVERLHQSREDVPRDGITIDATASLTQVVDEILAEAHRLADPGALAP